jgi:hypothetical protein
VIAGASRQLLSPAPSDALVPELFDFLTAMAPRMEAGEISPGWASYLFTSYERDLAGARPTGVPRRSVPEIERTLQDYVEYFRLQAGRKVRTVEDAAFEDTLGWRNDRRVGR